MGRYRGALAGVRPDDLAAQAIAAAVERTGIDPAEVDDVFWGAANQAGEDNRDVARMASLLAGLPVEVPGVTVNRLCASGLEAVNQAVAGAAARRGRPLPGRRLGVDEPRPVGDGRSPRPACPRRADAARHGARLAPGQPADGGALLDRVDGRDGRERRRALRRSRAPTRTRSRSAATSARSPPRPRGGSPSSSIPVEAPGGEARRDRHRRRRRGPARRHHARAARGACGPPSATAAR